MSWGKATLNIQRKRTEAMQEHIEMCKLLCSDEIIVDVELETAVMLPLIKLLVADAGKETVFPLVLVSSKTLKKVVCFLDHVHNAGGVFPDITNLTQPSINLSWQKDVWYHDFIATKGDKDCLFDLAIAANYLQSEPLLKLANAKIAALIKGKDEEEKAQFFTRSLSMRSVDSQSKNFNYTQMKLVLLGGLNGSVAGYKDYLLKLNIFEGAQVFEINCLNKQKTLKKFRQFELSMRQDFAQDNGVKIFVHVFCSGDAIQSENNEVVLKLVDHSLLPIQSMIKKISKAEYTTLQWLILNCPRSQIGADLYQDGL